MATVVQPVVHKRGQTFNYLMKIPDSIPDKFMLGWRPKAQLRKARNSGPSGLIASIYCKWVDNNARVLLFHHNHTHDWPLGLAEFDVKFESPTEQVISSNTITFDIIRGISQ